MVILYFFIITEKVKDIKMTEIIIASIIYLALKNTLRLPEILGFSDSDNLNNIDSSWPTTNHFYSGDTEAINDLLITNSLLDDTSTAHLNNSCTLTNNDRFNINPATGLPMIGLIDAGGNPFGIDSTHINLGYSSQTDTLYQFESSIFDGFGDIETFGETISIDSFNDL